VPKYKEWNAGFSDDDSDDGINFNYKSIGIKNRKEETTIVKIDIPSVTYKAFAWHQKYVLRNKDVALRQEYEKEFVFEVKSLIEVVNKMMKE
jgi:hypothetical protein